MSLSKVPSSGLSYEPVNKAGDTMTGGIRTNSATTSITFSGSSTQEFSNTFKSASTSTQRAAAFIGSGNVSCWWADNTSGTPIAVGAVDGVSASSGGGIALWANNSSAWYTGVRVNGAGSVNLPNQPIISGQVGSTSSFSGSVIIPFDEFWVSRGITYNSSTRRFTVPNTGIYRITMNPFKISDGGNPTRVLIGVNTDSPGTNTHYGHTYTNIAAYGTMNLNTVVSLSANDYIVFYLYQGTLYNQSTDRFNQFSIEMIA